MNQGGTYSAYRTARAAFLALAARYPDVRLGQQRHPDPGPDGEPLFVDTAWFGPRSARSVLVTISGTHGVEGIAGSMIQRDWMERGEPSRLPPDVAVLLIHGLNPWGFAWLRRTDQNNVDLNRNWVDFSHPLPRNAAYGEIAGIVEPAGLGDTRLRRLLPRLLLEVFRHSRYGSAPGRGMRRIQAAVSGGQHDRDKGLFFGGTAPAWSGEVLGRIAAEWLSEATFVAAIDFHTGLGKRGAAEKMTSAAPGSDELARAERWFGGGIITGGSESSTSAEVKGDLMKALPDLLPQAVVGTIALEFGTRPTLRVLQALVADNWLHSHGDPLGPDAAAIKKRLVAAFFDEGEDWKEAVTGSALRTSRSVIAALASEAAAASG